MSVNDAGVRAKELAGVLRGARSVLVTTHAKPDGDAFGCVLALAWTLRRMGRQVRALFVPPAPEPFGRIAGASIVEPFELGMKIEPVDVAVVLDTAAWNQVEPMRPVLEGMSDRLMVVDHHLSGDMPAKWRWVDAEAGACAEMVAEIIEALKGEDIGIEAAEGLYVGIASDTGWFRFSNTRPGTLELAARLLRRGVDHARIYRLLEQTERPEKLALMARALASLRLVAGGRAAMMTLRAEDFTASGARLEETERIIDLPQMIQSVEVVALVTEPPPEVSMGQNGAIRVSLRSKPGPGAVNVADLAAAFGGGGHARAAGAKVRGTLEGVVEQVRGALERAC